MAYCLGNVCTKITEIGQLLLKLSLVVGLYPFLRHRPMFVYICVVTVKQRNLIEYM